MVTKKDSLKTYKTKRNLKHSPEPKAKIKKSGKEPIFVVQQHDASHMHYDFRLEADGVLKSWAVPKGPSMDPQERHLAIQTEDHPLDYASFEGIIPKGEYGAGEVIVWDTGPYKNLKSQPISKCIENGELTVWLEGKKLKGGFALVKTNYGNKNNSWIFLKMRDDEARAHSNIIKTKPKSVLSQKTIKQIKEDEE